MGGSRIEHLWDKPREGYRVINTGLLSSRIWEGIIQRSCIEGLILNGDGTLLQVKRKQSKVYIEMRIMFFHFAPDISINTEVFYWEIMTLSLKIHKMLVCQDIKSVTYTDLNRCKQITINRGLNFKYFSWMQLLASKMLLPDKKI